MPQPMPTGASASPLDLPAAHRRMSALLEQELEDLQSLPAVAMRLVQELASPDAAVPELARLIAMDQALAAKVLRLVNSSFYGFPRQVATVSQAVVILGFNAVRNLTLAVALFDRFSSKTPAVPTVAFWEHSVAVAIGAQLIAQRKRLPNRLSEEAFLAGLLHDIGKLFLCQHFPDHYQAALQEARQQRVRSLETERVYCGATHPVIGKKIAERWNLPLPLLDAIARHHDMHQVPPEHFDLVALVSVSDAVTITSRIGFVADTVRPSLTPQVTAWLNLSGADLQEIQRQLREKMGEAREFLQIAAHQ